MGEQRADERDIRVELSQFNANPELYVRQANSQRRVIVQHDGTQKVSVVFGGALDASPSMEER